MKRRTLLTGAALGAMTGRAIAQPSCQGVDRTRLRPTFAEEFNKFDAAPNGRDPRTGAAVWRTTFSWGKDPLRTLPSNKEVQFYSDTSVGLDPFRLAGGVLTIEARPRARGAVIPEGLTYTSGLITTQESFAQTYGYFEFRARMPRGRGFWPALWLLPTDLTWPPEIDVAEMHGHAPDTLFTNLHSATGGHLRQHRLTQDMAAGFHTYAVSWRPDGLRWFFDDCEVARAAAPADLHKPMYLLACLAVGGPGSWPGPSAEQTSATLALEYIRAYQFHDLG